MFSTKEIIESHKGKYICFKNINSKTITSLVGDFYDTFFTASSPGDDRPRNMYYYDEVTILGCPLIIGQFYSIKTNNGEGMAGDLKEVLEDRIVIKHLEVEITIKLEDINSYVKHVPMTSRNIQKYYVDRYPDGILKVKADMKKDKFHGLYKQWYSNGSLYIVANYIDGKKDGNYVEYLRNGVKYYEFTYKNDELHGVETKYNTHGEIVSETCYKDGVVVSTGVPIVKGLTYNAILFKEKMYGLVGSPGSVLLDSRKITAVRDCKNMDEFEKAYEGLKGVIIQYINNNFPNQSVQTQVFVLRFFETTLGYRKAEGKDIEGALSLFNRLSSIMSIESLREYKKKYNPSLGKRDTSKDVVKRLGFNQM